MANDSTRIARAADHALEVAERNVQQAQRRLSTLLAAARLAATARARKAAAPLVPSGVR